MSPVQRRALLAVALFAAASAFMPGAWGPLLLDSVPNLDALKAWLAGDMLWQGVVFGNESGPLGRPVAMASFLLNAATTGESATAYKLTNLLIHVACGALIVGWLTRMLRHDPTLATRAGLIAAAIAIWWTVLPLHASTVLYSIQRMAQLSTLFMLCGLWLYVYARDRMLAGDRIGHWLLWLGIPLLTGLAAYSKENGLLLPLLCLAVELGYYRGCAGNAGESRRSRSVWLFFLVMLAAPALIACAYIAFNPEFVTAGYVNREFTLAERLLTQSRVLWTYVQALLVPLGPGLGLYHDSYPISHGVFTPATTAIAIGGWALVLGLAVRFRTALPSLLTGVLLFLFGHAMESGVFALELVFMHRNYLPGIGVLLAVVGAALTLHPKMTASTTALRRPVGLVLVLVLVTLWAASFSRAWNWQSKENLLAAELRHHPGSLRARMNAASLALSNGRPSAALHQAEIMESLVPSLHTPTVLAWKVASYCAAHQKVPPSFLEQIREHSPAHLHHYMLEPLSKTVRWLERDQCGDFNAGAVAEAYLPWLGRVQQPAGNERIWKFRHYIGNLYALAGDSVTALRLTYRAWQDSGRQFEAGVLAFRLSATLERYDTAREILRSLEQASDSPDLLKRRYLAAFREFLAAPESYPGGEVPDPAGLRPGQDNL